MSEQCSRCHNLLDSEARGSLCSTCWFRDIRSRYTEEELERARTEGRVLQGNPKWFLPPLPVQGTLFE